MSPPPPILVIDDNPAIHEDYDKILKPKASGRALADAEAALFGGDAVHDDSGYEIDHALQGEEGLARVVAAVAAGRPYALAFIDMRMPPGWDGVRTVQEIWKVDPDIQIVLCTAYSDYSWKDLHERFGTTDRLVILKKPFDVAEVAQLTAAMSHKWELARQTRILLTELEDRVAQRTTELISSNARLQLTSTFLEGVISTLPGVLLVTDTDGVVVTANDATSQLLEYTAEEVVGAPVHRLFESPEAFDVQALSTAEGSRLVETVMRGRSGAPVPVLFRATVMRDEHGENRGGVCVALDLRDQKRLEFNLRQAQRLESVGRLAAGVAHEINTPIQYVGDGVTFLQSAFTDLLALVETLRAVTAEVSPPGSERAERVAAAERSADLAFVLEEVPAAFERIFDGTGRVATIVSAMRDFAHPGQSGFQVADINRALQTTLTVGASEYKHVATIETDFGALPPVTCSLAELNQVFLNLIVNAAHAISSVGAPNARSRGVIRVKTYTDGPDAVIEISDTGCGIPEAAQPLVFEPFFTTKPIGVGTGQGLAIAYSIVVDRHRGAITFDTRPGEGTTFRLRLPIAGAEVAAA